MKRVNSLIITIMLWYLVAIIGGGRIPYFHQVIIAIFNDFPNLAVHSLFTITRLVVGIVLSLAVSFCVLYLMFKSESLDQLLSELLHLWYPIPKAALTPAFIILFGIGERSKLILIVAVVSIPLIIQIRLAILNFPSQYTQIIADYNISKLDVLKQVYLKGIAVELFSTLKVAVGMCIAVLYISESSFGTMHGLGYYITRYLGINPTKAFAGIFCLAVIGYLAFELLDYLAKRWNINN